MSMAAIIHVTDESTTPGQRESILALVAASNQLGPQVVVAASSAAPWRVNIENRTQRIPRRMVALSDLLHDGTIVHHWSGAAGAGIPFVDERLPAPVVLDLDSALASAGPLLESAAAVITDSLRASAAALRAGARPASVAVVRPWVDFSRLDRAARARVRASWGLRDDAVAALILPPIARQMGSYEAAWAALLVERVQPALRIVVPAGAAESLRLERLAESTGRSDRLILADGAIDLPSLLMAADLALFTPPGDCPHRPIAWALAAGCPIVASATHSTCELLAHDVNARLCRENEPRFIARRILETLEAPDASRELIAHARRQAYALFSRQRMIEQVRRVYENVASGRSASDGLIDPLFQTAATR